MVKSAKKKKTRKVIKHEKLCKIKGCDREIAIIKHKMCNAHAVRFYRTGHPGSCHIRKRSLRSAYKHD